MARGDCPIQYDLPGQPPSEPDLQWLPHYADRESVGGQLKQANGSGKGTAKK